MHFISRLDVVEIKGKRGRKVPILLTREVKKVIDVLVEKRGEVGVNAHNPYLFAATGNGLLGHLTEGSKFVFSHLDPDPSLPCHNYAFASLPSSTLVGPLKKRLLEVQN